MCKQSGLSKDKMCRKTKAFEEKYMLTLIDFKMPCKASFNSSLQSKVSII